MRLIQLLNNLLLSIREVNFKATKDAFAVHTFLEHYPKPKQTSYESLTGSVSLELKLLTEIKALTKNN